MKSAKKLLEIIFPNQEKERRKVFGKKVLKNKTKIERRNDIQ